MVKKNRFDLIVIGGGVVGTFHAYHATNRGLKVALFERNVMPRGATVQNFGQVVPSGMNEKWQKFGRKSLEIYKKIQSTFDISVRQNGSIYIASDHEELQLLEELYDINQANEYSSQLLTPAQCTTKYPSLRADYCKGGLYFPEEVSVNPRLMIHRLHAYLKQNENFHLFNHTLITELYTNNGQAIAKTNMHEVFAASKAIVCSGHEFNLLFPEIFSQSDLEVSKLQMLKLKPQKSIKIFGNILTGLSIRRYESFSECPSFQSIKEKEDNHSFWKKWGIHILFKQEEDGSIILGDSHEYVDAGKTEELDFDTRTDINDYFIQEGQKIFNLEHWNIGTTWFGLYSQCKDQDIFQQTIDEHIHIVTGIGGKGMTASAGFTFFNLKQIYND